MNITENGSYSIVPNGIDEMDIEVNIPVSNVQTSKILNVNTNGSYLVSPDEGYDAIRNVSVNVDIEFVLYSFDVGSNTTVITEDSVVTADGNVTIPANRVVLFTRIGHTNKVYLTRTLDSALEVLSVKKYVALPYSDAGNFMSISITKTSVVSSLPFFGTTISTIGVGIANDINFYLSGVGISTGYLY